MSEHISYSVSDGVATLAFDRADKKNAITVDMYEGLVEGLSKAATDPAVRVVRVRGEGDAFCAGNDIKDFMNFTSAIQADPEESAVVRLLWALVDFEKPLVGEVRGPAVGIGTTMLLHFDLVYASPTARFHMPFVSLGLSPEGGSTTLLAQMCGHQRAAELLMLSEPFTAEHAKDIGLVNEIVSDGELEARALERCQALTKLPAASLRATKSLMRGPHRAELKKAMREEVKEFAGRLGSPEATEAFTAFLEKRAPDFNQFE
jgi:enoyl-CoA hydratase/carnithine racemase